ncbi:MAG: hypothetical protein HDS83_02585 [Bacteroidales bacterium]|nr:hypothetical protein [Bacteroidales bacterium]
MQGYPLDMLRLVGDQQPCLTLPSRHRSVGRVDYDNTNVIVGDDEPDFVTLAIIPDARAVRPYKSIN